MKSFVSWTIYGLIAVLSPQLVSAVTVVECVDARGEASFRDKCLPGMTLKSSKKIGPERTQDSEAELDAVVAAHPVTLYSAPNCDSCDVVRNLLVTRNIPFSEKDASQEIATQTELKAITDGALTVPLTVVGEKNFSGYQKSSITAALNDAGYPEPVTNNQPENDDQASIDESAEFDSDDASLDFDSDGTFTELDADDTPTELDTDEPFASSEE